MPSHPPRCHITSEGSRHTSPVPRSVATDNLDSTDDESELQASTNTMYVQLALNAGGTALAIVVGLVIWSIWTVLADFRDAMLWALLCSVALRDIKDYLVSFYLDKLSGDRTLLVTGLSLLLLPFTALLETLADLWSIARRWHEYANEYEAEYWKRTKAERHAEMAAAQLKVDTSTPGAEVAAPAPDSLTAPAPLEVPAASLSDGSVPQQASMRKRWRAKKASKRSKRRLGQGPWTVGKSVQALSVLSAWWATWAQLGYKAFRSSKAGSSGQRYRGGPSSERRSANAPAATSPGRSRALFRWLWRACLVYEAASWLASSWSAAAQLVLLLATMLGVVGLLPFLYFTAHWYLSLSAPAHTPAPEEAVPPPQAATPKTPGTLRTKSLAQADGFNPFDERAVGSSVAPHAKRPWLWLSMLWRPVAAVWHWLAHHYLAVDRRVRMSLKANLHTVVAVGLMVALLLGTTLLSMFVAAKIGEEGRTAVFAVKDALPTDWTLTGEAATSVVPVKRVWRHWIGHYQHSVLAIAQRSLPAVVVWAEAKVDEAAKANNVTQVLRDVKTLYATLQPPVPCTPSERQSLLVELARAGAHAHRAADALRQLSAEERRCEGVLAEAVARWDQERLQLAGLDPFKLDAADELQATMLQNASHPLRLAEEAVEAADVALHAAQQATKEAHRQEKGKQDDEAHGSCAQLLRGRCHERQDKAAQDELKLADRALGRCAGAGQERQVALGQGMAQDLGRRLQSAYRRLWQLQLMEGVSELSAILRDCVNMMRDILQGKGDAESELNALQRLSQAAADPLISLGRALGAMLVTSLGSTTVFAWTGGLGIMRLGVGMVKFGIQFMLFAASLFYLLAAETDPLLHVVRIMPLSDTAREHAAAEFSRAMRGVFLSALNLAVFHATFTWLTFRAFGVPFAYFGTLVCGVCAMLPLIPSWVVAVPAALQLVFQDNVLQAIVLLLLHIGAYYQADDIIMREIPGSHPFLIGLGVFGGMYTWNNPIQGALMGPMLLSLLSVFYKLHAEYMATSEPPRSTFSRSVSYESFSRPLGHAGYIPSRSSQ
ncbi:hypothetical protein WJX72_001428 [[Myrmecia] bisecta]|uniref:Transmembrane protein 245 n=1 Tax=[Myrmecia] bisecta TaxID=41462 RepID=A0AAW1PB78_9CHLO